MIAPRELLDTSVGTVHAVCHRQPYVCDFSGKKTRTHGLVQDALQSFVPVQVTKDYEDEGALATLS